MTSVFNTQQKRISVIIPVYNAEGSIHACLQSVKNQEGFNDFIWELIIVNDGSSDASLSICERFAIENPEIDFHIIHQENRGVSVARNAGILDAKYEWIAFLDADDVWKSQKTIRQFAYLNKYPNILGLGCLRFPQSVLWPYKIDSKFDNLVGITFRKLLLRNELQSSTLIIKKEIVLHVGLFETESNHAEDHLLWLKISKKYPDSLFIINENLIEFGNGKRSFGEKGLSADLRKMLQGSLFNLKFLKKNKWISYPQFILLNIWYLAKYILLRLRILFPRKLYASK